MSSLQNGSRSGAQSARGPTPKRMPLSGYGTNLSLAFVAFVVVFSSLASAPSPAQVRLSAPGLDIEMSMDMSCLDACLLACLRPTVCHSLGSAL